MLLRSISEGDQDGWRKLFTIVYSALNRLGIDHERKRYSAWRSRPAAE